MPAGRGYKGWGQRRLAQARSRSVAGTRGGGGIRTVSVHRAFSGAAYRARTAPARAAGKRRMKQRTRGSMGY